MIFILLRLTKHNTIGLNDLNMIEMCVQRLLLRVLNGHILDQKLTG